MVLQKRLEYGFNGYQVPPIPRAPRSARKRVPSWKKNEDHNKMCAFDLLATVAGKLSDGDDSADKINREETKVVKESMLKTEIDYLKANVCDQESCNKSFFVSEIIKAPVRDTFSGSASGITGSDFNIDVIRDDDEKSCGHTQSHTLNNKPFRAPPRIGDRRIKRLSAYKQWKAASNTDMYRNKKSCYKHQRSIRDYPFKKRRLYQFDSTSNSNDQSDSIEDGSSLSAVHDSHVKLKIKSLRVPEFFIEIPETATVSSLKRTVMEAVTAIFSGELHVGVMLQGKRIRDDNKTLLQTDLPMVPLTATTKPLSRYSPPTQTVANQLVIQRKAPDSPVTNSREIMESDHGMSVDSRALVTVPSMNAGALALGPVRKFKRAEVGQRRIRRPFSVSEVEALVEAVERLGTGRWRDVKIRAFDDAKHRTYVDLKDKWKTLVHTARISPQQRRGEPVPQELLDRVLSAHGYWSHHQAKNQFKHQLQTETCRLL
nr:telomere repeat-binding protein 5-like isoform X1 [Tanacetum cinerariifolium]